MPTSEILELNRVEMGPNGVMQPMLKTRIGLAIDHVILSPADSIEPFSARYFELGDDSGYETQDLEIIAPAGHAAPSTDAPNIVTARSIEELGYGLELAADYTKVQLAPDAIYRALMHVQAQADAAAPIYRVRQFGMAISGAAGRIATRPFVALGDPSIGVSRLQYAAIVAAPDTLSPSEERELLAIGYRGVQHVGRQILAYNQHLEPGMRPLPLPPRYILGQ